MLGIQPSTFYRWYDRYRAGGPGALEDKPSRPDHVWNRIPDEVRQRIIAMALDVPEFSPRELATRLVANSKTATCSPLSSTASAKTAASP